MAESKTSPRLINAAEKQAQALQLRKKGMTYDAIAKRIGYANPGSAEKAIKAALHKMIKDDAKDVLALELARLDDLLDGLYHMAENGNPMAVDRVLRIMERRANYLGLDAPKKVQLEYELTIDQINRIARILADSGEESPGDLLEKLAQTYAQSATADRGDSPAR